MHWLHHQKFVSRPKSTPRDLTTDKFNQVRLSLLTLLLQPSFLRAIDLDDVSVYKRAKQVQGQYCQSTTLGPIIEESISHDLFLGLLIYWEGGSSARWFNKAPDLKSVGPGSWQWWERSPPTNVTGVRFLDPASYEGWVCCCFSTLPREVFLRVLRFSPLIKNQHFKNPIRFWNARTFLNEFLWAP